MNKNIILAFALCAFAFESMTAQVEKKRGALESYSYIEVQAGEQLTFTNAKMDKLLTPVGAFSIGHYFTPVVGARLHVNGWKAKSGFSDIDRYYKWNYVTADADLMLNITNMFCRNKWKALNLILVGGFGLNNTWNNTELKELVAANSQIDVPLMWKENRLGHNIRAGLRLETNMSKPLGLSLEVDANSLNDRFNSKTNDHDDWMVTGMLGISFRFGHKYKSAPAPERSITIMPGKAPEPAPVPEPAPEPKPVPVKAVEPTPAPEPVKVVIAPEAIHEEAFYQISISDPDKDGAGKLQKVAEFMKRNPDRNISIVGYADKNTGNPKINMMYSQKRAEKAKNELVNKYGIDASRIFTSAKGDTVQPFAENDKNRCVIIDGK